MTRQDLFDLHYERQNGICDICKQPLHDRYHSHIDRITPGREGGAYIAENTRLICASCDWEREGNAPDSPYPELAGYYRGYKTAQLMRTSSQRRLAAMSGDVEKTTKSPYLNAQIVEGLARDIARWQDLEDEQAKLGIQVLRTIPVWDTLKQGWGMGEILGMHLLSRVDIRKADTVSSLWRFLGYDPSEKYNPGKGADLKSALYASLSITLIRTTSPYRADYDTVKAKYAARKEADPDGKWSPHKRAMRWLIKLWLSHLWETWRKAEGLPTASPWIMGRDGHNGFIPAAERGWPSPGC
jgi:hypothetical protein